MSTTKAAIGLQGYVKVEVVDQDENVIEEYPWQPNLILDQGLNAMASVHIARLFDWATGGSGTSVTKETVVGTTYTLAGPNGTTLTRTGGRDFASGDIGKLVKITTAPFTEGIINVVTGATAELEPTGQLPLDPYTSKLVNFYSVQAIGLDAEFPGSRTNIYSAKAKQNITTDDFSGTTAKRTMQRAFVFPAIPMDEVLINGSTYTQTATTLTLNAGPRTFTLADVGKWVRVGGAEGSDCKITGGTSTVATITTPKTVAGGPTSIYFYTGRTYNEVGFSHLGATGNNLNIRVKLSTPVLVDCPRPGTPSQQLRVTYKLDCTVGPSVTGSSSTSIDDPTHVMSNDKSGSFVIERLALSKVNADGTSNVDYADLEPAEPSNAGWSTSSKAPVPVGGTAVDRSPGATGVPLVPDPYDNKSFTRQYLATFGLNDAVNANWKTLGLFDDGSQTFPFVFVFTALQNKTSEISVNVRFQKTWNRALPNT